MENPEPIPEFRPAPAPGKSSDNVRIQPRANPVVIAAAVVLLGLGFGIGRRLGHPPAVVSTPAPAVSVPVPLPLPQAPPAAPPPTAQQNLPFAPAELGKAEDAPAPAGTQAQHPASAVAAYEDDAQCPVDTPWRRKVASERAACVGLPSQILTQERTSNGSYIFKQVAACPAHQTPMTRIEWLPTPHPAAVCDCMPNTCQPYQRAGWLGQ